ncbi:MAG: zinc ribbon domain-containing protein [Turicibacter sp.]|nr:zinc ribbon domain-containing protein [Turicibacter sp.]
MNTFLKEVGQKLTKTGQGAIDKTKNFAEVSRLNLKLAEEEQQLEDLYANLGRLFYKVNQQNPDFIYREMFGAIEGSQKNADFLKEAIIALKGTRSCPQCKEEAMPGAAYCAKCGQGLNPGALPNTEIVYKLCTSCGEISQSDDAHCHKCQRPL